MTPLEQPAAGPEFAYIDETGDIGAVDNGGSTTFTLGCVLVPMKEWISSLDTLVGLRRDLKRDYGLSVRHEVKANHLVGVKKVYRELGLGDGQVRDIYQRHLDATASFSSGVCAVTIHKSLIKKADPEVFNYAWEYLLTRLRKRTEATGQPILIVHDDGEADRVRTILRRFRRHNWQGGGYGGAPLLVEDPVPRNSTHSVFIQAADLTAYAASRYVVPVQGRTTRICDATMWNRLQSVHLTPVSTRGDGVYKWPT